MGSFYQNGIVANLHDFSYGSSSEKNYKKLENDPQLLLYFYAISKIYKAKKKGANIICLPELFLTNYFCQIEN